MNFSLKTICAKNIYIWETALDSTKSRILAQLLELTKFFSEILSLWTLNKKMIMFVFAWHPSPFCPQSSHVYSPAVDEVTFFRDEQGVLSLITFLRNLRKLYFFCVRKTKKIAFSKFSQMMFCARMTEILKFCLLQAQNFNTICITDDKI